MRTLSQVTQNGCFFTMAQATVSPMQGIFNSKVWAQPVSHFACVSVTITHSLHHGEPGYSLPPSLHEAVSSCATALMFASSAPPRKGHNAYPSLTEYRQRALPSRFMLDAPNDFLCRAWGLNAVTCTFVRSRHAHVQGRICGQPERRDSYIFESIPTKQRTQACISTCEFHKLAVSNTYPCRLHEPVLAQIHRRQIMNIQTC
jgi:hypothetical protein